MEDTITSNTGGIRSDICTNCQLDVEASELKLDKDLQPKKSSSVVVDYSTPSNSALQDAFDRFEELYDLSVTYLFAPVVLCLF